ncbi:hypothetical protein B0H12DRAFT_1237960 [Mycena haematopus]|nr:hypothetical protein B0H12DRAFT_1237960 [Mycena haematopus]
MSGRWYVTLTSLSTHTLRSTHTWDTGARVLSSGYIGNLRRCGCSESRPDQEDEALTDIEDSFDPHTACHLPPPTCLSSARRDNIHRVSSTAFAPFHFVVPPLIFVLLRSQLQDG